MKRIVSIVGEPPHDRTRCSICRRRLNQRHDPLSEDCGGDCLACIIWAETGDRPDGIPHHELATWVQGHRDRDAAWCAQALADLDDPK